MNSNTKVKGDKLIFTQSNSVYRYKAGSRPTAEEIITTDEVKTAVYLGSRGQRKPVYRSLGTSGFLQAGQGINGRHHANRPVANASHNIYAYRFTSQDGSIHEGFDDDGEYGAGRSLLKAMIDNEITNALFVVSRWFGGLADSPILKRRVSVPLKAW